MFYECFIFLNMLLNCLNLSLLAYGARFNLYFLPFRYFEEFEKRIPRAEMEQMEVIKHTYMSYVIK